MEHPGILDAAVTGMPDDLLGEKVCAWIVTKNGKPVSLPEIATLLFEKGVARYKHPERVEQLDAIPRNSVGKIIKTILRKKILEQLH